MMAASDKENAEFDFQEHLRRKRESKKAKEEDKIRANEDDSIVSVTFDPQSVLQIPHSNASLMYYSRKTCLYNLCIWEARKPNDPLSQNHVFGDIHVWF
ncbi:hypothetical protein SNE40_018099 [Patella caerulea]